MQRSIGVTAFQSGWLPGQQAPSYSWVNGVNCARLHRFTALPKLSKRYVRWIQVNRISASENGVGPIGADDRNDKTEFNSRKVDPAVMKEKLLRIITELINDDSQIQEVEKLILQLESLRATPITDIFAELGLAGTWKLIFSSTRTRSAGNVRIRKIGQVIKTEEKQLINIATWSFPAKDGINQIAADLFITCSYKFAGPGRLEVKVEEHKIKVLGSEDGKKYEMPDDLQALVTELQLTLPVEFFDPTGLIDVSYMEPNFRLARFVGKKRAGVRNVFLRDQGNGPSNEKQGSS